MSKAGKAAVAKNAARRPAEPAERDRMIAVAAYYRAERRGFEPGHELEDWLAAEAEIKGLFARREGRALRSGS